MPDKCILQTIEFLRHFEEAVCRPLGYLLADLKPLTPESGRMRTDVLEFKDRSIENHNHLVQGRQAVQTYLLVSTKTIEQNIAKETDNLTEQGHNSYLADTMKSCDDCGVFFANMHDLQNHVKL